MSINTNFYRDINDLVTLASGGEITGIVDRKTFIDAGTALANLSDPEAFKNAFIQQIANKVQLSIDTARTYTGAYQKLTRGHIAPGGVIEMITHGFFAARQPKFPVLTNGQSIDQYEIAKPEANVDYFVKDNAGSLMVTIQEIELRGAFKSPEAMETFLRDKTLYLLNSYERQREAARLSLVADTIVDLFGVEIDANTEGPDSSQMRYRLLTMFNKITGGTLTADNALYNAEFVTFACSVIRKVYGKIHKVSSSYNLNGIETFTPKDEAERMMFVNSAFVAAQNAYVKSVNFHPENAVIPTGYEEVPNWGDESHPLQVTTKNSGGNANVQTAPVVALLADKWAMGEYVEHSAVRTTPYNAAGEYYNEYLNYQLKLVRNKYANTIAFTLE